MTRSFHTLFLECKSLLNTPVSCAFFPVGSKNELVNKLDKMLEVFPDQTFKDLLSIHLAWDDTVRLIIDCVPANQQIALIKKLFDEFSTADLGIVSGIIDMNSISKAEDNIEEIRKEVLLKYYTSSGENEDLVTALMQDIYNIEV